MKSTPLIKAYGKLYTHVKHAHFEIVSWIFFKNGLGSFYRMVLKTQKGLVKCSVYQRYKI